MGGVLFWGMVIAVAIFAIASDAPWQKFRKEHIEPLEKIKSEETAHREVLLKERESVLWDQGLFERNLQREIQEAVAIVRACNEEMVPLKEEKAELHAEQDQVIGKLEQWHNSSQSYFGKRGQKIPQSSFLGLLGLGQTLDQRDSLVSKRGALGSRIVDVKSDLDEIYFSRLEPAKRARDDAWRGKERLRELRRLGIDQDQCRTKVTKLKHNIEACDANIAELDRRIASEEARFKAEQHAIQVARQDEKRTRAEERSSARKARKAKRKTS